MQVQRGRTRRLLGRRHGHIKRVGTGADKAREVEQDRGVAQG